jgi:hypothetical protein
MPHKIYIDMEEVARLRDVFETWQSIARILNVNYKILYRRCIAAGYTDNCPWASVDTIINLLIEYRNSIPNPSMGERYLHSYIRSKGFRASKQKLSFAIHQLDPDGQVIRIRRRLRRREYCGWGMVGFGHMNHIDGKFA